MTDSYPRATDLLKAVSECLQSEIVPALDDRALQFKMKIAVNVLAIVEREISRKPESNDRDKEQLETLLGEAGELSQLREKLNDKIAEGAFDGRDEELLASLQAASLRQLAIDNPNYSTYQSLTKDTRVL
ncbi:MAG TPA: hypothetical protein DIW43_13580 [Spongiibacteraceae bacterium]|nr:hypothetical protein [Spongiibacteraceae bacterium]HCS28485.1 hypothetical protein [Spongiibacteraceae bacterium]|tara:strand:- start:1469 stop:1858 length:390 start_codon:yes stop_codon:yes gene_type:complete